GAERRALPLHLPAPQPESVWLARSVTGRGPRGRRLAGARARRRAARPPPAEALVGAVRHRRHRARADLLPVAHLTAHPVPDRDQRGARARAVAAQHRRAAVPRRRPGDAADPRPPGGSARGRADRRRVRRRLMVALAALVAPDASAPGSDPNPSALLSDPSV